MARSVIVDTGFLVAILSRRDFDHQWALNQASQNPPPWYTCEAALSEAFHLIGQRGAPALSAMLLRNAVIVRFDLGRDLDRVLTLMTRYANVPMSLADACLVRMSETITDPFILTTDSDFRVYRRHSRQMIPCALPPQV